MSENITTATPTPQPGPRHATEVIGELYTILGVKEHRITQLESEVIQSREEIRQMRARLEALERSVAPPPPPEP